MPDIETKEKKKPSELIFFEVDINHPCWACDLTEKFKDTVMTSHVGSIHGDDITNVIEIKSITPQKDIDFIKKHPLVKKVEIVMLKPNGALLRVTSSYKALTIKLLHESNVTLLESPTTQNGLDSEILLARSYKDLSNLINKWKEQTGYDVKLKSKRYLKAGEDVSLDGFRTSGFFDLKAAKELLTPKQLEIFKLACDYGYYENPKKVSINQLAERTGISAPTLAEHLRKAEAKLMPMLMKVLMKI